MLHSGSRWPYLRTLDQAGKLARDKHSSLIRKSVNYGSKKFYSTGPRFNYKPFTAVKYSTVVSQSVRQILSFQHKSIIFERGTLKTPLLPWVPFIRLVRQWMTERHTSLSHKGINYHLEKSFTLIVSVLKERNFHLDSGCRPYKLFQGLIQTLFCKLDRFRTAGKKVDSTKRSSLRRKSKVNESYCKNCRVSSWCQCYEITTVSILKYLHFLKLKYHCKLPHY